MYVGIVCVCERERVSVMCTGVCVRVLVVYVCILCKLRVECILVNCFDSKGKETEVRVYFSVCACCLWVLSVGVVCGCCLCVLSVRVVCACCLCVLSVGVGLCYCLHS